MTLQSSCRNPSELLREIPRRILLTLISLAVLAFALRVGTIFAMHRWKQPNAIEHRALAVSPVRHHTFYFRDFNYYGPSSVQSPPYPFLLAVLFKFFGEQTPAAYIAAMVINSIAGALTVWLMYGMTKSLGGSDLVSLLAAGLVAVWPSQIYSATHVQAISLITLGIVAMIYFFQRGISTGRLGPWMGYSIVGCLCALTEPVLLPILAASGLFIFAYKSLSFETRLRNAAVLLGAAIVIILPWTVRNRVVHGDWVPVKSTFWVNVWKGNNPNATGTDRLEMTDERKAQLKVTSLDATAQDVAHQYDALTPEQRADLNRKPEADREKIFKKYATTWIAAHPAEYLKLCIKRLGMTLLFDLDNPKARNIVWIGSRITLVPLTLIGLWLAKRNGWHLLFPLLVWGSALLTYTLTVTANRFAIPFEPFQLALTALVASPLLAKCQTTEPRGFDVRVPETV
jgi:hypothetical protein